MMKSERRCVIILGNMIMARPECRIRDIVVLLICSRVCAIICQDTTTVLIDLNNSYSNMKYIGNGLIAHHIEYRKMAAWAEEGGGGGAASSEINGSRVSRF
jgi:hypothetical protein